MCKYRLYAAYGHSSLESGVVIISKRTGLDLSYVLLAYYKVGSLRCNQTVVALAGKTSVKHNNHRAQFGWCTRSHLRL